MIIRKNILDSIDGDIILATQFYFESVYNPLRDRNFGLIAELGAELGLSEPYYTATENTLQKLSALKGLAWRQQCPLVIETWSNDLIKAMVENPDSILKAEADVRQHFWYPPFGIMYRIRIRGDKSAVESLKILERDLLDVAIMAKTNVSNTNKPFLELRLPEPHDRLSVHLQKLPDSYIIEVNPTKSI